MLWDLGEVWERWTSFSCDSSLEPTPNNGQININWQEQRLQVRSWVRGPRDEKTLSSPQWRLGHPGPCLVLLFAGEQPYPSQPRRSWGEAKVLEKKEQQGPPHRSPGPCLWSECNLLAVVMKRETRVRGEEWGGASRRVIQEWLAPWKVWLYWPAFPWLPTYSDPKMAWHCWHQNSPYHTLGNNPKPLEQNVRVRFG